MTMAEGGSMSEAVQNMPEACPVSSVRRQAGSCPFSAEASAFDPFDAPYQVDPVEALRWSRSASPSSTATGSATGSSPATTT